MNRVGLAGCCKPEERLEEKLYHPPTPAMLPHVAPCVWRSIATSPTRANSEPGALDQVGGWEGGSAQLHALEVGSRAARTAYLSFGRNDFPRRRHRSENLVIRGFQPGVEELSPGAQRPSRLLHTGASGRHPRDSSYPADSAERRAPSSTFSEETAPLHGLPNPPHTPGPRSGENQGPSPSLRAQSSGAWARRPLSRRPPT